MANRRFSEGAGDGHVAEPLPDYLVRVSRIDNGASSVMRYAAISRRTLWIQSWGSLSARAKDVFFPFRRFFLFVASTRVS
jgi:hypothetical protein